MILPFGLYVLVVAWAAKDGDLYAKEVLTYAAIFAVCLAGFLLGNIYYPGANFWFVIPVCLIDIYLIIKLIGNPQAF